jgi:hypothetical protein
MIDVKRLLDRNRCGWKDTIKMDLSEKYLVFMNTHGWLWETVWGCF